MINTYQQPTTNNQQPATSNQQPTTSNQQPATNNQQPATNNYLCRQEQTETELKKIHEHFETDKMA